MIFFFFKVQRQKEIQPRVTDVAESSPPPAPRFEGSIDLSG